MQPLEVCGKYYFDETELKRMAECAEEIKTLIKEKNLTFAEAKEALRQSEILIEQSLVG